MSNAANEGQGSNLSRNLPGAKEAFAQKNAELSRLAHSGDCKLPFCAEPGHKSYAFSPVLRNYAKAILTSGTHGIVISCVIMSGILALGFTINGNQLLQLSMLNLIGIGATLGYSHYLEKKAELSVFEQEYRREKWECDNYLEGEQKEMVELYVSKGMTQVDAETVIKLLSKNEKMFVDIMMVEELGLLPYNDLAPPWSGFVRFLALVVVGCIPMIAFTSLVTTPSETFHINSGAYHTSLGIAASTLLLIGFLKETFYLDMGSWWKQGSQNLLLLALAILPSIIMARSCHTLFI